MTTIAPPAALPKLDVALIADEERLLVADKLREAPTPEDRLSLAATIIENALTTASKEALAKRDAAALRLSLYDGIPQVHLAVGLSRAYFHDKRARALDLQPEERGTWLHQASPADVARRAAEKGVPYIPDAARVATALADVIVRANVRARVARAFRDNAVLQLHDRGWSRRQIAELGQIDDSRVSQIVSARP